MFDPNNQNRLRHPPDPAFPYNPNTPPHSTVPFDALNHSPGPGHKPRSHGLWGCLAFLTIVLFLTAGVIALINTLNTPSYFPPIVVQQLPVPLFLAIGFGLIVVLGLLIGICWRIPPSKLLGGVLGMCLLAFLPLGFLWAAFVNPYVSMTPTGFTRSSVMINSSQPLHLQNPADGVTQILCIGVDQKCRPEDGAPEVLNGGIRVRPGQSVIIPFGTDGQYHITSETIPAMNLSVDVNDNGGD